MKLETIDRISSGLKACANATGLYPEQAQSSNLKGHLSLVSYRFVVDIFTLHKI